ncbi:MAG TPA: xanthine dehydrogenase family protein subunit M [Stellaceae bacterium]|nr:xanthine dehydrogenase family protein subunit M [Stellaceae bacterium]
MIPFTYLEPSSVDETLAALVQHGVDAKLIAGGTGLVNLMKQRLVRPSFVIGLRALKPLAGIAENGGLRIGALTTLQSLATSAVVARAAPLLAEACGHVATVRVRSMATLGGAVAHADPHLDTPPTLIALDGRIVARSQRGQREIPADQFFTGFYETVLEPDELVTEILVPAQPAGTGTAFLKFLPATHDDYATVSVAARVTLGANGAIAGARVALGAAAMVPVRATAVESALQGATPDEKTFQAAAPLVAGAIDPIEDFRGSADYKRKMAAVFVRRALAQAAARAKRPG